MRTFEFSDASSHKFWNIELKGKSLTIRFGRIGSAGQTQLKELPSEAAAQKEHDKLVAEKLKKGYRETTPSARPAPASLRESLERSLEEDPDDLAAHMAYADYLTDQGDPLGEFIRLQLALEDPTRPTAERKKLQKQEQKLFTAHCRDWYGDLAPYLLGEFKKSPDDWREIQFEYTLRRGWLDSLRVSRYNLEFTRVLARSPQIRLLRRLALDNEQYEEVGEYEAGDGIPEDCDWPQLYPLARCPYLGNVRVFLLGEAITDEEEDTHNEYGFDCHTNGEAAVGMVKQMPKLEELYLLAHQVDADQLFSLKTLHNLRILQVYHNQSYPLARLAKNPSLRRLTHLLLHPHALEDEDAYIREPGVKAVVNSPELGSLTHLRLRLSDMGDKGVRTIIASGILKRLKVLDLKHGCVTDEGARALAACPDLKNLERLDLSHNALTEAGVQALQATGVNVRTFNQWRPGVGGDWGDGSDEYLYAGDIE